MGCIARLCLCFRVGLRRKVETVILQNAHSFLRATIGSRRLALSAGMHAAASATATRIAGTTVRVSGSEDFTLYNCAARSRVSPNAAARPKETPAAVIRNA